MSDMKLPIHIEVKQSNVHRNMEEHEATDIFVSGNGYQWSGFTVKHHSDLIRLRDAINKHIWEKGLE